MVEEFRGVVDSLGSKVGKGGCRRRGMGSMLVVVLHLGQSDDLGDARLYRRVVVVHRESSVRGG